MNKSAQQQRDKYAERRGLGLCPRCGMEPMAPTHGECSSCRAKRARYRNEGALPKQDPETVFWSRVRTSDGCWEWTGGITSVGYGIYLHESLRPAHCVAYEFAVGKIPDGYVVDHLCLNPQCVRPDHLEAVTRKENLRRGVTGDYSYLLDGLLREAYEYAFVYSARWSDFLSTNLATAGALSSFKSWSDSDWRTCCSAGCVCRQFRAVTK